MLKLLVGSFLVSSLFVVSSAIAGPVIGAAIASGAGGAAAAYAAGNLIVAGFMTPFGKVLLLRCRPRTKQ